MLGHLGRREGLSPTWVWGMRMPKVSACSVGEGAPVHLMSDGAGLWQSGDRNVTSRRSPR